MTAARWPRKWIPIDPADPHSLKRVIADFRPSNNVDSLTESLIHTIGAPVLESRSMHEIQLKSTNKAVWIFATSDSAVFARSAGELNLRNGITVVAERTKVEARPVASWIAFAFREACETLNPVFGAAYDVVEWTQRASVPRPHPPDVVPPHWDRDYLGPEYDRHLPGLFWGTFFGPRYVELMGRERLLSAPASVVEAVGEGVLIRLGDDPRKWRSEDYAAVHARVLDHLGREYFFDPGGSRPANGSARVAA